MTSANLMPSSKPKAGINDLKSRFPLIAAEAHGWDPSAVTFGSKLTRMWKCELGHTWEASVNSRTSRNNGCPFCSGKRVLVGFNDLNTVFPHIASEADQWDPQTITSGTNQKKRWKCILGHTWEATIANRTHNNSGCPVCTGKRVEDGFNDLKSKFPDIAKQAHGWDPCSVTAGSNQRMSWECSLGHIWSASVKSRTTAGSGCPFCAGNSVLNGFNDLLTKFPDIAAEAYDWDPREFSSGSGLNRKWRCQLGHIFEARIVSRTAGGRGCPYCSGKRVLKGFNDLVTTHPNIASEAHGWDPSTASAGVNQKKSWMCRLGHKWESAVHTRTIQGSGCPFCSGMKLLAGFNDLSTRFPDIADEAYDWDPASVTAGSHQKKTWRCREGHIWDAQVKSRTSHGTGCPICCETGFSSNKEAWFYLMQRSGEQQFGITNNITSRIKTHERNGWTLLDYAGPSSGKMIQLLEAHFKKWLRNHVGLIEGTTENWATTSMEVQTLAELKIKSGIETDLF